MSHEQIRCVDNGGYRGHLTNGKVYEVISTDDWYFRVVNDFGNEGGYAKSRFEDVQKTYTLILTEDEKDALFAVLYLVGGNGHNSPRKFINSVYNQLQPLSATEYHKGYQRPKWYSLITEDSNGVDFDDFPPEPVASVVEESVKEGSTKNTIQLKAEIDLGDAKKDVEEFIALLEKAKEIKDRLFKEG